MNVFPAHEFTFDTKFHSHNYQANSRTSTNTPSFTSAAAVIYFVHSTIHSPSNITYHVHFSDTHTQLRSTHHPCITMCITTYRPCLTYTLRVLPYCAYSVRPTLHTPFAHNANPSIHTPLTNPVKYDTRVLYIYALLTCNDHP